MDSISLIKSPISAELEDFKKHFDSCLSSSNLLLNSVIAHIRQKNGKMMRPILVLLAAKLYNEICPATLHAAVALELLHTASLVHDDVVDESTERRGQLSVNAVFNNKVAVLTGDYLLATALVEVGMTRNYGIIDIVSKLGQDLAEGELLQLSNVRNPEYSEDIYFDVIRKKTAVLFAACMKAGALSVGAGDEKAEYARLFGEYIGLCFQIKDDIFDYYESKEIGKPTGNDMLASKICRCFDCHQVLYEQGMFENEPVSTSKIMTSQRYSLVTYAAYDVYCTNRDWNTLDKILELDAPGYYMMNILDYLVGNTDRHWENWGLLVDNETNQPIRLHDLMDFNRAFQQYDTPEGANCLTVGKRHLSQKDAAVEAVRNIGLNQVRQVEHTIFSEHPAWKATFEERLRVLRNAM